MPPGLSGNPIGPLPTRHHQFIRLGLRLKLSGFLMKKEKNMSSSSSNCNNGATLFPFQSSPTILPPQSAQCHREQHGLQSLRPALDSSPTRVLMRTLLRSSPFLSQPRRGRMNEYVWQQVRSRSVCNRWMLSRWLLEDTLWNQMIGVLKT
ncbi:hypothetical protein RYX36_012100 [Vicia faba]